MDDSFIKQATMVDEDGNDKLDESVYDSSILHYVIKDWKGVKSDGKSDKCTKANRELLLAENMVLLTTLISFAKILPAFIPDQEVLKKKFMTIMNITENGQVKAQTVQG